MLSDRQRLLLEVLLSATLQDEVRRRNELPLHMFTVRVYNRLEPPATGTLALLTESRTMLLTLVQENYNDDIYNLNMPSFDVYDNSPVAL